MKMEVLFCEDLIADYVELVHNFDLRALLGRGCLGAVWIDGNVAQLPRIGDRHVINSIEELEAAHDPDEQMIRILFEVERVQDALQGAVEADLCRFLNVSEVLVVAMQDENERRNNFMHALSTQSNMLHNKQKCGMLLACSISLGTLARSRTKCQS